MKVIIDTDGGLDDALAILTAVNLLPRGTVVAITTVFGNVDLHQATHNVKKVLEVSKDPSIPVFSGAHAALVSSVKAKKWDGHGPDGLGGAAGIAEDRGVTPNDAVPALIQYAQMYPGELVVIPIGPATNIALAIAADPSFVANVSEVLYMGCTIKGVGNITPHAEFNTACDPEACHKMLSAFVGKVTVVGWELTLDHGLPWSIYHELCAIDTPEARFLRAICASYESHQHSVPFVLCDVYTAVLLIDPTYVLHTKLATCAVHLPDGPLRGACTWTDATDPATAIKVVWQVDTNRFVNVLRRLVQGGEP
ncbi:hypothetical protein H310_10064 [Aphanomyces invadans]|uniref:Inosine/uridine-preferring nucleoside hydrolase domain-containing protein n=1 Tax=Aphanomyces invadans TaxID=157072 RepID=A0A024TSZ5_9STRA|nr:hypothetical protein H310_10064 [Aphanomyces invadans]ETV96756.1 hypothetical protein H310_10064 [Aphanomyces invadans]|eukprot:XP_008874533.1 hypothetical protein H310_10064 [Aphanomyces invadans]